jgi:putative Mn2+ efflux pump MntP
MVSLPGRRKFVSPISLFLVALAMSTDAFAAAVAKGASLQKPRFSEALRTGVIFGIIEAITPVIGWGIGQVANQFVSRWDHWIAFCLLLGLGLHMIYRGFKKPELPAHQKASKHSFWLLAVTAFATSIDALAVGIGLAFVDVNIVVAALAIGVMTMAMVTLGVMLGRAIGTMVGQKAEIVGGLLLIVIGALILVEHMPK